MSENQEPRELTPDQAMADADTGGKIADMLFGKIPEKKE